jgi:hypothetical protein
VQESCPQLLPEPPYPPMAAPAAFLAGVVHEYVRLGAAAGGQGGQGQAPPGAQGAQPPAGQAAQRPPVGPPAQRARLAPGPDAQPPRGQARPREEDHSSSDYSSSSTEPPRRVRRRVGHRPKAAPAGPARDLPAPPPPPMYVANYQGGGWPGSYQPPQAMHAGAWGFPHPPQTWAPVAVHYPGLHQPLLRGHGGWHGLPGVGKGRNKGDKGAGRGGDRGRRGGCHRNWFHDEGPRGGRCGKPGGKNFKGAKTGKQPIADRPEREERLRDHHESVSDSD